MRFKNKLDQLKQLHQQLRKKRRQTDYTLALYSVIKTDDNVPASATDGNFQSLTKLNRRLKRHEDQVLSAIYQINIEYPKLLNLYQILDEAAASVFPTMNRDPGVKKFYKYCLSIQFLKEFNKRMGSKNNIPIQLNQYKDVYEGIFEHQLLQDNYNFKKENDLIEKEIPLLTTLKEELKEQIKSIETDISQLIDAKHWDEPLKSNIRLFLQEMATETDPVALKRLRALFQLLSLAETQDYNDEKTAQIKILSQPAWSIRKNWALSMKELSDSKIIKWNYPNLLNVTQFILLGVAILGILTLTVALLAAFFIQSNKMLDFLEMNHVWFELPIGISGGISLILHFFLERSSSRIMPKIKKIAAAAMNDDEVSSSVEQDEDIKPEFNIENKINDAIHASKIHVTNKALTSIKSRYNTPYTSFMSRSCLSVEKNKYPFFKETREQIDHDKSLVNAICEGLDGVYNSWFDNQLASHSKAN